MCHLKSAILLKNRVYVPDHDHHSRMLEELGIEDDFLNATKTFVRVELSPPDGNVASSPDGWALKVDQDKVPDWFDPEADTPRIREAVKDWWHTHVFTEGVHEVRDGTYYASGSATVNACGSSTVYASGSATVYAYNSATVYAYDSATVNAYGSATVNAYGSATVNAYGSATVYAYGSATVYAYNSATVYAYGSATVNADGSVTVILPNMFQTDGPVVMNGEAICINHKTHVIKSAISWTLEEA